MTEYDKLRKALEKEVKRSFSTPSDFKWLSQYIYMRTHENISYSTLMRFWGYMESTVPSKVTLNILSRTIGYTGYDDFLAQYREQDDVHDIPVSPAESKPKSGFPQWMIWTGAVAIAICIAVIGVFVLKPSPKHVYITDIKQLSNTKQYLIHTRHEKRGSLGVFDHHLATTYTKAKQNRCGEATPFAIIYYEGSHYLYSVTDKRFIECGIQEHDAPRGSDNCALNIHKEADSCFVIDYKIAKFVNSLNVNSCYGPLVTDYGTINKVFDDGNLFMFEEIGDFDPTEALAMLKEPNPEYQAALKAITPGRYVIYTEYPKSKAGKKSKRYYLRADGHLTKTLNDSCLFTIQIVNKHEKEKNPVYRLPAWCIVWYSKQDTTANAFECPAFEGDKYTPGTGHLCVDKAAENSWVDKVFFLGKNGCYAIRSTNMPMEIWGCGLYWSVFDNNNDGKPEADYSHERAYIWKLKKI